MKTQLIGAHNYQFLPLPNSRSVKVLTRLVQILGPSISDVLGGMKPGKKGVKTSIADLDIQSIGGALKTFASMLKDGDIEFLTENLFGPYVRVEKGANQVVDLTPAICDLHFAGNVGEFMKVLMFSLKENFGSFLGDLGIYQKG